MKQKKVVQKDSGLLFMGKCGVFIDAANLSSSAKKFGLGVDYKKLSRFFLSRCENSFLRYYGPTFDFQKQQSFFAMLNAKKYKIVTKPIKVIHDYEHKEDIRKANFDVEIAVDAVRLIRNYDVFVLFSGDSDFSYVCKYLKKSKKTIVILSTRWRIARELISLADYYFDIIKFKGEFLKKRS